MSEAKQFRAIKGTRDILPPVSSLWNWFEATARRVMESYGYREIRLPIFEQTELFARSIGADTDVVSKEMYTFDDPPRPRFGDLGEDGYRFINSLKSPRLFAEYVRELKLDLESGAIIATPSTVKAVQTIEGLSKELVAAHKSLPPESDEESLEALEKRLEILDPIEKRIIDAHLALRKPDSITLRPEATASVVRAYIEHGMHRNPGLTKLYYVGPMFRRERPQKGRYRQFYQIGAEVLGPSDHPAIDAELIEMLTVLLAECGLEKSSLLVNSIGCKDCRPKYVAALRVALADVKSQMCADCQRRAETNPLRVLDCKVEADQPIIAALPSILDHLDAPCREHFMEFQRQLGLREIPFTIQPRLVRGLDYYMRTTFEITSSALGAQNALVGGGRYDGLSELLGGPPAKGIGFALGTDRFILAIDEAGKVQVSAAPDVLIAWIGAAAYGPAVRLARQLRAAGLSVEVPPEEMKLKKSLGLADKLGAQHAILLGETELAEGKYVLRRMADGEQQKLGEAELVAQLAAQAKL